LHHPENGLRSGRIAVALLLPVSLLALETQVIPDREMQKHRVSMATLFYGSLSDAPLRTMDFVVTRDLDGAPIAEGRGKSGQIWRITLPPAIRGLWMAGRPGKRTYYFAGYTGGAGMAPDTWILAISLDEHRLPVPFDLRTFSGYDANGIKDLVELDGTEPVLLQQTWLENDLIPDQRSGYYITNAYRQEGVYWYRADGPHGSGSFPAFEKWAKLPGTRPELVRASYVPSRLNADRGNDPRAGVQARISAVDERGIHATGQMGCKLESVNVIVNDSARGRRIEVGYFYGSSPGTLLPEIARHHNLTTFTGLYRWPAERSCTASIAWTTF
jgi:hypothetical protein